MFAVSATLPSASEIVAINAVIDWPYKLSANILVNFDSLRGTKFSFFYKAVMQRPKVNNDLLILLASC